MRLAILVGPQGAGKTTVARELCRRVEGCRIVKAIPYTLLQLAALRIINAVSRLLGDTVSVIFYEDEPPHEFASPRVVKALVPLLQMFHLAGLVANLLFLRLKAFLKLKGAGGLSLLIEDEGFVFKQIPDYLYLVHYARGVRRDLFLRPALLTALRYSRYAVLLDVKDYDVLRARYYRQKRLEAWRKVEPPQYITLQLEVYRRLVPCAVDAERAVGDVVEGVLKCLESRS